MCGVFGAIAVGGPIDMKRLRRIGRNTESRGRHAHGLAWVDAEGRLRRYKAVGAISDNMECLDWVTDARVVIGHCRYATHGSYSDSGNNHPHSSDGGWIVHNGVIGNAERLAFEWGLPVSTECDSEVLGLLIEAGDGTLLERCRFAMSAVEGAAVMLGLWAKPWRMILARRGNPLHVMHDAHGNVYFASLPDALDSPQRIIDNTVRLISRRNGQLVQQIAEVEPCRSRRNDPLNSRLRRCARLETSAQPWWDFGSAALNSK